MSGSGREITVPSGRTDAARATMRTAAGPVSVWLRPALRAAVLGLGAVHTVVAVRQQSMSEDGINYLDIGTAFFDGNWPAALNPVWSPLYGLVLGAVQAAVAPPPPAEFAVVQVTNFAILVAALFGFEWFWGALAPPERAGAAGARSLGAQAPALWLVLGYSLFAWASLNLITVWAVTPDMLVAALVFILAGCVLRLPDAARPARACLTLGAIAGTAYLAKAAMFPLGLALLVLAAALPAHRAAAARFAWMALAFAVVAGPFAVYVSRESGYPTFGDVGRFTYMKHVNALAYPHWGASIKQVAGTAVHPPRLLVEEPRVYAFGDPVGGTYPLAFNPGYWTRGLSPRVNAPDQLRALAAGMVYYFDLFLRVQGGFVAVVGLLLWLGARRRPRPGAEGALVLWAAGGIGLYALVYTEARYVAPFIVILWAALLALVRLGGQAGARELARPALIVLSGLVWINIVSFNLAGAAGVLGVPLPGGRPGDGRFSGGSRAPHVEIAHELRRLGLTPGARVGVVGDAFEAYWARLGRLRIVADIPPEDVPLFWHADEAGQARVVEAFRAAGAAAIVAELPQAIVPAGWQRVGSTPLGAYLVR